VPLKNFIHIQFKSVLQCIQRFNRWNICICPQVVHGFDLDACRVLFDGADVWTTDAARNALHAGFMLVDPLRQSPSYEYRLAKYSQRYGLDILVPGEATATVGCERAVTASTLW
jgi:hypothetical protein